MAINTTLSAVTPCIAGARYDAGHGYGASFYFLSLWCLVGGAVLMVLRMPSNRGSTPAVGAVVDAIT